MTIMGMQDFISRWAEYARWFYHKPWEWSELLVVGLVAASLLVAIVRSRQNVKRIRKSDASGSVGNFRDL